MDVIVDEMVVFDDVDFFLFADFLFSSSLILMTFSTTLSNVVFLAFLLVFFKSLNLLFFLKALTATLTRRISSIPIEKENKAASVFQTYCIRFNKR